MCYPHFFFNDTATTEIYTLSLHDALPILIRAAAEHGIALVLGSGRRLLDDPESLSTYRHAADARPPLLLANLGAAQVRGPQGPSRAHCVVGLLDAEGLSIHLNPIQAAVQPEGEPDFAGVLGGIAAVVRRLAPLPVVVKEVGVALDPADVVALEAAGVAAIDVRSEEHTSELQSRQYLV